MTTDQPPLIAWFVFWGVKLADDFCYCRECCSESEISILDSLPRGGQKGRFDTLSEAQVFAEEKQLALRAEFPDYEWEVEVDEAILTDPRPNGESIYSTVKDYISIYGVDPRNDVELVHRYPIGSKEHMGAPKGNKPESCSKG